MGLAPMNTEITKLKEDIKVYEAQVKLYQSWLNNAKSHLQSLQKQVDDTVVDGLRMRVREFIENGRRLHNSTLVLKRLEHLKYAKSDGTVLRKPYLELRYSNLGYHCTAEMEVSEEEAFILSSQAGCQTYNIDCSIWDTYRYPGEID